MSSNAPDAAKAQAIALVQTIVDQTGGELTKAQLEPVIRAVARDLEEGAGKVMTDEVRLAKVETQTRVLAEAVIAISETAESLAPALKAVKDEM